jgi:hypothetical protein
MQNVNFTPKGLRSRRVRALAVICVGCAISFVGCTAEVETARPVVASDDADLVEVQTVPADIYAYPHVDYRGRPVYYVNGRWYSGNGQRWYYYLNEPPDLVRHRRYIETAPPARSPYVQPPPPNAPPGYYPPPSSYAPPPAVQPPSGDAVRVR